MKRAGGTFERIASFDNLYLAAKRARSGKRSRPDVAAFHYSLEHNLLDLREELITGTYRPGAYRTFRIRDPKPRTISAAPYRDRVVHHALCSVIEPLFERTFFPNDDLFTPVERQYGLPIGNLTSQLFGNVYLNGFDHFVCENQRWGAYIRFVDDFLLFGASASSLQDVLPALRERMDALRLSLHPRKCVVSPTRCGVEFLGWRVYPDHRRLRRATGIRIQRGLRNLQLAYSRGEISRDRVRASVMSWIGHLKHGDTWGLRSALLEQAVFARNATPLCAEDQPK